MRNFKSDYDKENDDLFLYSEESKSSASIEIGDIVLDFDKNKGLVGMEIMGATNLIKSFIAEKMDINKTILSNIISCKVETISSGNFFIIKMVLLIKEDMKVPLNISIPRITTHSPSITC